MTEQKEREQALREKSLEWERTFDAISDWICLIDREARIIRSNKAGTRLLGIAVKDLIGKTCWEIVHGSEHPLPDCPVQKMFHSRQREEMELYLPERQQWWGVSAEPLGDEHGTVIGAVHIVRDISERKQAEHERQFQANLLNMIGQAVISTTPDGIINYFNRAAEELYGWPANEAIGRNIMEVTVPEMSQEQAIEIMRNLRRGESWAGEFLVHHRDGAVFPAMVYDEPIFDSLGNLIGIVGISADITERKRTEQRLQENEIRFRELFDTIPSGVAFYQVKNDGASGKDYIIRDFNKTALRLEGREKEDVIGKSLFDLRPEIDDYGLIPIFQQVWKTGEAAFYPATIYIDEHYANYYENRVFRLPSGEIVAVYDDVTTRKRAEEALRQVNQKLELRIEARTRELRKAQAQLLRQEKLAVLGQLAGSVAHELRHPLSVLTNAAYFLKMSLVDKDETTDEYLEIITVEIRTAEKIISDLLDFSRNQLTEKLVSVPTQVAALVAEVLAEHSAPAGIDILREIEQELPSIIVDPQQIKQVLANLVLNAYQAMPDGGALTIICKQLPVNSQEGPHQLLNADNCLLITVKDTGSGIAPEYVEKLFEPLFTTKAKGIGLGLAICKNLVEANGGRIVVESVVGKGAAFTLTLPAFR